MKNFSILIMLSLIISQSCVEDTEPGQQQLHVGFTAQSSNNEITTSLPPGSKLIMNVQSQSGENVLAYQEVVYQSAENEFVTELDLPFGNYTITDFMLINSEDEIIYAAPKSSGALATAVTNPLALDFMYTAGAPVDMKLRLLDVRNHKASDFGYASFKRPGHGMNVMVSLKGNNKPASAMAAIQDGNTTVGTFNLSEKMNHITIPTGISGEAKLVVSRSGYAPQSYKVSELVQEQKNKPLKVTLEPAFTMLSYIGFESVSMFSCDLEGPEGSSISVDWGDGTTQVFDLNPGVNLTHSYTADGNYPITITGDIDKITSFYSYYGQGMIDEVSFEHLTDLKEIRFGLTRSPVVLDLTHNSKLEFANIAGLDNTEKILLPASHSIRDITISGPNPMTTEAVDAVINSIHKNAVEKNIQYGSFGISHSWAEENSDMVGPPSADGMAKLQILKDEYGWEVYP